MTGSYNSGNFNLGPSQPIRPMASPSSANSEPAPIAQKKQAPVSGGIQSEGVESQNYNQIVSFVRNNQPTVSAQGITQMNDLDGYLADPTNLGGYPGLATPVQSGYPAPGLADPTTSWMTPSFMNQMAADPYRNSLAGIQTGFYGGTFSPFADPSMNQYIQMPSLDAFLQADMYKSIEVAQKNAYNASMAAANANNSLLANPNWGMPTSPVAQQQPAVSADPTTSAGGADPNVSSQEDPNGNTDPYNVGDTNDTIEINDPDDATDTDTDTDTEGSDGSGADLLDSTSDVLDMGGGLDEVTVNASNRKGTIKISNVNAGEATDENGAQATEDIVTINGKHNKLTISGDKRDAIQLNGSLKTKDNPDGEWVAKKGPKKGTIIYTNKKDGNVITVKGGAQVLMVGEDGEAETAPDLWAPVKNGLEPKDPKAYADTKTSTEIAHNTDFSNMTESEQDYVAFQFLLRLKNSEADDHGIGVDIEDPDFSTVDIKRAAEAAKALGNQALSDRLMELVDAKQNKKLTLRDGKGPSTYFSLDNIWQNKTVGNGMLSREELEKIRDEIKGGKTLKEITDETSKLPDP